MPQGLTWLESLEAVIRPAFAPVPLVWDRQDGAPRPDGLYVSLRIDGAMARTRTIIGKQDANGLRQVNAHRTGTLEFQAFGLGGFDLLDRALQMLSQQDYLDALNGINTVLGPVTSIADEPALRDAHQWEPRAIASMPVSYTLATDEVLSWIETVEGVGDVDGAIATDLPPVPYSAEIVDNPTP